jgi:hypothetical protein
MGIYEQKLHWNSPDSQIVLYCTVLYCIRTVRVWTKLQHHAASRQPDGALLHGRQQRSSEKMPHAAPECSSPSCTSRHDGRGPPRGRTSCKARRP